jgi:hypothetical protein
MFPYGQILFRVPTKPLVDAILGLSPARLVSDFCFAVKPIQPHWSLKRAMIVRFCGDCQY